MPRAGNPVAILAIILISYFMILLDNSVIFTGLPSIRSGLDLTPTGLSWVQDAYTLVFGGLLLLGARAGDIVGRRRLFVVGLAIFGAASLLIGASLGLLVGGALTEWISWRAAFLVNVPVAVAMIIGARIALAETPRQRGRFDVLGAACATLGMGALVFGIIESGQTGWGSVRVSGALLIGVVLVAALVANESRVEQPIMLLRLFRSRERTGAYAARMLYMGAMIGFFYFTTQYMQDALGFTPLQAGLGFLPMSLVNFAVAMAIPRLSARIPNAVLLAGGTAVTLAGMVWLSRAGVDDGYLVSVALPMMLVGAGQGLAFAPLTNAGIAGVAPGDAGAASGLVNTAHQLGMAIGLGVLVAVSADADTGVDGPAAVADHVSVPGRPTVEVQVKTATDIGGRTAWPLNDKAQQPAQSQHEWFVFVLLPPMPASPRGFVVPRDHAAAAAWIVHQDWLTSPDIPQGQRNASVSQARVDGSIWEGYEDRWDLLGSPTQDVAVLLPSSLRERARLDRVGLPPGHPWATQLPQWQPTE